MRVVGIIELAIGLVWLSVIVTVFISLAGIAELLWWGYLVWVPLALGPIALVAGGSLLVAAVMSRAAAFLCIGGSAVIVIFSMCMVAETLLPGARQDLRITPIAILLAAVTSAAAASIASYHIWKNQRRQRSPSHA